MYSKLDVKKIMTWLVIYPTPRNALFVRWSVMFFTPSNDTIQWPHCYVRHTAWEPEGREGRSQGGPKGRKVEVGAQRAPKLLVMYNLQL